MRISDEVSDVLPGAASWAERAQSLGVLAGVARAIALIDRGELAAARAELVAVFR